MYFVQHWFNLADEACEEALLEVFLGSLGTPLNGRFSAWT